ncbi:sirohydrochlorin chelatase [Branchiibius sp. NY16-3462-2]|uniref:sirohydrochlorin chelatase n=1 Tax=Branchiibius sp. NY16-3462-2 TaxID=1807500 RepID=UPI0007956E3A|nr:CbiX/SirB N-terminal domain-containing protein [Branchiibius sp. NY16-3462-2]KYH45483.1 hypothetical protein AZH51_00805 [Branchiibius sp. NY16-3462-2]
MTRPVLILCAHGTANPQGQQVVSDLHEMVRDARPDLQVERAYVDVQSPSVVDVVARWAPDAPQVVVVPVLLATGYHVQVDIADAVAPLENARSADPLGPDPVLSEILAERIAAAGLQRNDALVVAAAGSSRPDAKYAPQQAARELAERLGRPVTVGYGASAEPNVPEAVRAARDGNPRVVVASYLLAPGYFHDQLQKAGADVVTEPLGPDPRLAALIVRRFEEAR